MNQLYLVLELSELEDTLQDTLTALGAQGWILVLLLPSGQLIFRKDAA